MLFHNLLQFFMKKKGTGFVLNRWERQAGRTLKNKNEQLTG